MANDLYNTVKAITRSSETVKAVLETELILISDRTRDNKSYLPSRGKRILAVLSHTELQREEGCLLVLCPRYWDESSAAPHDYAVEEAIPIGINFVITITQSRRNTLDLRPSNIVALSQSRTELSLAISPGHDSAADPLSFVTQDIQGLQLVLSECRRLKDSLMRAADGLGQTRQSTFAWTAPYMAKVPQPSILTSGPPDLRTLNTPLHTLLSPASAGAPGDEASDIELIREDWVRSKIREELTSNSGTSLLRIRVGTFNVNGKLPTQDLSTWVQGHRVRADFIPPLEQMSPLSLGEIARDLFDNESGLPQLTKPESSPDVSDGSHDPDILVFGFQEVDLSTEALLYSTSTVREDAWCMALFASLGEKAILYEKLVSKQLVGMLLIVIVRKSLSPCFGRLQSGSVGAGIMGVMGNKGAVALRVEYTPHSQCVGQRKPAVLTFVNSHLAAFDEMYERRNADFQDLSKRLVFEPGMMSDTSPQQVMPDNITEGSRSVFETDVLIWMVSVIGLTNYSNDSDLNYRINLSDSDIRGLLSSEPDLIDDEIRLGLAIRTKKAFDGFCEHPITHLPSYRFSMGIVADHRGYDVKRKPAWTDRILYFPSTMTACRQSNYTSHPEITMSDHKPVSAEFEVDTVLFDMSELNACVLSHWKNVVNLKSLDSSPKVRLRDTMVDFGSVRHACRAVKHIKVENVGDIACSYRFIGATPEASIHPEWITIERMTGLVPQGSDTDITISLFIGDSLATCLNSGNPELACTLIMHTAYGKDHFITVAAKYERTCFANNLEWLARLPVPIRTLSNVDVLLPADRATSAPREVMRLINWLMSNAAGVVGLFVRPGQPELISQIREVRGVRMFVSERNSPAISAWTLA
ncbi:DNase I-like protein [Wolfiporia cocos MD-104 SS10]|uniref:DNase I-like protein n=1 Tax=Wolfiporia cocos (strain MD-104) TaxID=742152 RepID=A0A2H3JL95_WOLCO|nr:DNase I-like protein [Wolfiporia cocos MD-104 SS10]